MRIRKPYTFILIIFIILSSISITTIESYASSGSWKCDSKGWWYEYSDGSYPKNTWLEIDGSWYYFTSSGYMDYSEYRDGYWLGADGSWNTAYYGGTWKCNEIGWWYSDASGWYPSDQYLWIDGKMYYFFPGGYMAENLYKDGYHFGKNGAMIPNSTSNYDDETHGYDIVASCEGIDFMKAYMLDDEGDNCYDQYEWHAGVDGGSDEIKNKHITYILYVNKDVDTRNLYIKYKGDDGYRDIGDECVQFVPDYNKPVLISNITLCDDAPWDVNEYTRSMIRYEYMSHKGFNKFIQVYIDLVDKGDISIDLYYKSTKIDTIKSYNDKTCTGITFASNEKNVLAEVSKYKNAMTNLELLSASCYWYRQQDYDQYTCWSCQGVANIMKCRGLSSITLSCCYYNIGNDYDHYYSISKKRKVTNDDENPIGHRICIIFLDKTHYTVIQVQGRSDGFLEPWKYKEIKPALVTDDVSYLRDYKNIYELVKGDFGVDLSTFDPFDSSTWY